MDVFLHILQAPTQGVQGSPERVGQELVHPNVEPLKDYLVVRGDSAKNQCLASHQLLHCLLQFLQAFLVREGFESRPLIF